MYNIYIHTRKISIFLGSFDFELLDCVTGINPQKKSAPRPQSFEERKRPRTTRR